MLWPEPKVFPENDTSAFKGNRREKWAMVLDELTSERADALMVTTTSRITRTPREVEDLIDLHGAHPFRLVTSEGEINLGTPQGRKQMRDLGNTNANYSEVNSKALKDKHREIMEEGKHAGHPLRHRFRPSSPAWRL